MKNKLKILIPVGLVALALICVVTVRQGNPGQGDVLGAQQSSPAEETPNVNTVPVEEVIYTLPPIPSTVPVYTAAPEAGSDSSSSGETTTVEEDGTIVITPDFESQASHAATIVTPGSQVTANIAGGGGQLELGSDGAFHGDNKPTPAPAPTVAPTVAPVVNTPVPVETPAPEATPAPTPVQQPQGGPPSYNGTYDGQMSPDGKYMWIGGFGWNEYHPGAIGEQIDDSDKGWAPGEMGETVGTM